MSPSRIQVIAKSKDFIDIAKSTLERELNEELGISQAITGIPFIIYTPTTEKSKKHVAICWIIEMDGTNKFNLDTYEITQNRGQTKSGKWIKVNAINKKDYSLEDWSCTVLAKKFNRPDLLPGYAEQISLNDETPQ